jgi:hypothetical protein
MSACLTDAQWAQYDRDGYLVLGRLIDDADLSAVQRRIDDIMLGRAPVHYDRLLMQLDSDTGRYEDLSEQTKGFKGPTLGYRKIQDLEYDQLFRAFLDRPIFRELCVRVYSLGTPIAFPCHVHEQASRQGHLGRHVCRSGWKLQTRVRRGAPVPSCHRGEAMSAEGRNQPVGSGAEPVGRTASLRALGEGWWAMKPGGQRWGLRGTALLDSRWVGRTA